MMHEAMRIGLHVLFTRASATKTGFHLGGKQLIAFQCTNTDSEAGQNQGLSAIRTIIVCDGIRLGKSSIEGEIPRTSRQS